MGYYRPQGDYYSGYRGDPGIGSFFRGLVTKATSFIPGVGPVVSGVLDKVLPGGAKVAPAAGAISAAAGGAVRSVQSAIVKHPVLTAAGAAGALGGTMGAVAERVMGGGGACGMGHRNRRPLKKCGTILKSGKCGKCYRSMNVCNPHALRRAVRRARGFAKLAMKTIHIVHPKKKGRFGGWKKRKRS